MLVGAYSFVAIALFAYLVSLARRLTAVQHELERLEGDVKRGGA
jgi:CcmD family protein